VISRGSRAADADAIAGGQRRPRELVAPRKTAFVSDRDGNLEIYVMNPDGSGQHT